VWKAVHRQRELSDENGDRGAVTQVECDLTEEGGHYAIQTPLSSGARRNAGTQQPDVRLGARWQQWQASNGNGDLIHIGPNPAACSGPFSGADSGVVIVDSNVGQSTLDLNVSFQYALPNQTYVVDIRCVGKIGSVTTDAQGTGTAQISLPIPQAPTGAFYLDVSVAPPGGAGSGGYGDTFIAGPFSLN